MAFVAFYTSFGCKINHKIEQQGLFVSTLIEVSKEWILEVKIRAHIYDSVWNDRKKILKHFFLEFLETSVLNISDLISIWQYNVDLVWRKK